jgi:hypothetical protein
VTAKSPLRRITRPLRRAATDTLSVVREPTYWRLSRGYRLPEDFRRVYCYHVRKTAGTSLHRAFLALGGEDPVEVHRRIERSPSRRAVSDGYAFAAHQLRVLQQGHYFYGWSHVPAHQISLPPSTFTVTILRDPVMRVVSLYSYLLQGDDVGTPFAAGGAERRSSTEEFGQFVSGLSKEVLLRQLYMFSARFDVEEAAEAIARCSQVMFTEDYDNGLTRLAGRLDLHLVAHRERVTREHTVLSDSDRGRLRELLDPEYALLEKVRAAEGQFDPKPVP